MFANLGIPGDVLFDYSGPCAVLRRMNSNSMAQCDDDGNFRATQCRSMVGSRMLRCFCVHPNGTMLNSRPVTVSNREDAPDCETRGECQ